jgi:hypothetical protein
MAMSVKFAALWDVARCSMVYIELMFYRSLLPPIIRVMNKAHMESVW